MSLSSLTTDVLSEQDDIMIIIEEVTNDNPIPYLKDIINTHSIEDFEYLGHLGEGSYAKVIKVRYKETRDIFALKAVNKKLMRKVIFIVSNSIIKRIK